MDGAALQYARELEAADERLAEAIEQVDALQRRAARVRERAAAVDATLERLPLARAEASAAAAEAARELELRRDERERAERALAEAESHADEEQLPEARRALTRARDAEHAGRDRLARAESAVEAVEREAGEAAAEVPLLEEEARALAAELGRVPRASPEAADPPGPGLAGAAAWAARARAALFVVRGGLDAERERVVRQANELGASVLGEPVAATSVSLVRRRLERAWPGASGDDLP